MNAQQEKKYLHRQLGPGGIKCYCCGGTTGKKRKVQMRRIKRSLRNLLRRSLRNHEQP